MKYHRQIIRFELRNISFGLNAQGINKIFREDLIFSKIFQTKPHLYYTVIRDGDKNEKENEEGISDINDYLYTYEIREI